MIGKFADEKPKCPLQMHFGEKDDGIPMSVVDEIKKKQPQAETYTYPDAPHGFYCDERASYRKEAGDLAWKRTQEFLAKHMRAAQRGVVHKRNASRKVSRLAHRIAKLGK